MSLKFQRTYSMTVQVDTETISLAQVGGTTVPVRGAGPLSTSTNALVINYPLTLHMEIERATNANCNRGHFKIMNLSENSRRRIFHDAWDTQNYRQISLKAGYHDNPKLPEIFRGNVLQASSYRIKQDWVTEINALDGGFGVMNGQASLSAPAGEDIGNLVRAIAGTLPNVGIGKIGSQIGSSDQSARGAALAGNSWDVLTGLVPDDNAFIDLEKVNVIGKNEYLTQPNEPYLISAATGLLETPRRGQFTLELKMLFEPQIRIGMLVQVVSAEKYYNGIYAVQGVRHTGTISGAVDDGVTTIVTVWKGTVGLTGV